MLLDSNIIIIASKLSDPGLFNRLREKETALRASVITKIEVLGYHQLKAVEQTFLENGASCAIWTATCGAGREWE
jgi:hypothetical protein